MKKRWWLVLLSRDEARLCAAAPDLYKALEGALGLHDRDGHHPWCPEGCWSDLARVALAEARGEP